MQLNVRRFCTIVDHTPNTAGHDPGPPLRKVAAIAIVENPYAGSSVEDLGPLIDASENIGQQLAAIAVQALAPFTAQSSGKGGIVGVGGEQEHINALLTTVFANPLRKAVGGGKAWIASFTRRGVPGTPIDVPLACKDALYVRSHYDGMTISVPDAPLADEIAVIICVANRGRLYARVGGLEYEDVKGDDGLSDLPEATGAEETEGTDSHREAEKQRKNREELFFSVFVSAASFLCVKPLPPWPPFSARVGHEVIVRRHLHLGKRRRVDDRVGRNQLVQREQVRHEAVDLVVAQRPWGVGRHRPPNVVEHRRRIRPVAADGLGRSGIAREGERVAGQATDESVVRPFFSRLAVAGRAARRVDRRAVGGRAAPRRESHAIGPDVDVQRGDLRGRGRPPDSESRRFLCRLFRGLRLCWRSRACLRGC
jgi:hypothetical protein